MTQGRHRRFGVKPTVRFVEVFPEVGPLRGKMGLPRAIRLVAKRGKELCNWKLRLRDAISLWQNESDSLKNR